ncbi:MAG: hypothetical protein Hals2KO_28720 [Halioglobus sp.]
MTNQSDLSPETQRELELLMRRFFDERRKQPEISDEEFMAEFEVSDEEYAIGFVLPEANPSER